MELVYKGSAEKTPNKQLERWLQTAPPWRRLGDVEKVAREEEAPVDKATVRRGETYISSGQDEINRINVALMLRRPLLVTGPPGIGKSTLAYSVAYCLGLGTPLRWEINSQTTLQDGLYSYDAVGHLRSIQASDDASMGDFITLNALGTAMLPTEKPRVLLIDELDKASFDLPNDLLHVFEEGAFSIPELTKAGGTELVFPFDSVNEKDRVPVVIGRIRTKHHPVVVITSNGERDFSRAFLRRCVHLRLEMPDKAQLLQIVQAQFDDEVDQEQLTRALEQNKGQTTDVLLQALFLQSAFDADAEAAAKVIKR